MENLGLGFWRLQCVLLWLGVAFFALEVICRRFGGGLSYRTLLKTLYWLLPLSILSFVFTSEYLRPNFDAPVQVWSGVSRKEFVAARNNPKQAFSLGNATPVEIPTEFPAAPVPFVLLGIGTLALGVSLWRSRKQLRQWERDSLALRKIGRVRIALSDAVAVPLSYRYAGQAVVLLPQESVTWKSGMQLAIAHEIQHHRHGDTLWSWIFVVMRAVAWFNPGFYLVRRSLGSFQELACDEALSSKNKGSSHAYACCLWEAAQTSLEARHLPAGTTGLVTSFSGKLLKWRIEMLTHLASKKRSSFLTIGTLSLIMLVGTALATTGVVQDRRVTLDEAKQWAETANKDSGFPIVVNEYVLKELNYLVGTPDGREFVRKGMERMKLYQPMIERRIADYGAPMEFLAIPLIESGYQNLPPNQKKLHGAGLWMFIQATAKRYGLRVVPGGPDDRLEPELETNAAMEYLKDNYKLFKSNWPLALLAYNVGEGKVGDAVKIYGYDAWTLIREGIENDHAYLPRVVAAMIILKNPSLVQ